MPELLKQNFQYFNDGSSLSRADTLYYWCLEHDSEIESVAVKGSLRRHSEYWEQITSDPKILKIVKTGYAPFQIRTTTFLQEK